MANNLSAVLNPYRLILITILGAVIGVMTACSSAGIRPVSEKIIETGPGLPPATNFEIDSTDPTPENTEEVIIETELILADVVSVDVSGQANAYQFSTTVTSPDTGCQQYADWWEVITEDGKLLYRRILLHSHVTEQPFTRSGGPVEIDPDAIVIIRAHLNPGGYGGQALKGSPQDGFEEFKLEPGFAADLEISSPLPAGCDF